jgi:hypothetical protein
MRKILLRAWHRLVWIVLLTLDISVNVAARGKVETISSRAGRARDNGKAWGAGLCSILDTIQPGHCTNAQKDPTGGL